MCQKKNVKSILDELYAKIMNFDAILVVLSNTKIMMLKFLIVFLQQDSGAMKNRGKELSQGSCAMRRNGMGIGRTRNRTRKAGAMLNSEANVNHNLMRNFQKKKISAIL